MIMSMGDKATAKDNEICRCTSNSWRDGILNDVEEAKALAKRNGFPSNVKSNCWWWWKRNRFIKRR